MIATLQRFKDTLRKNDEDFEDRGFYEVERDKCDRGSTDENVSTFGRLTHIVKEQSTTRQSTSAEDTATRETPFTVQTSSVADACQWQGCAEGDYNVPDARTAFSERSRSTDMPCSMEEQPLDCTSDMSQLQSTKQEPLDYTVDTDMDSGYRYAAEKILYTGNENAPKQGSDPPPRPVGILCTLKTTLTVDRMTSSKRHPELKRPSAKRKVCCTSSTGAPKV